MTFWYALMIAVAMTMAMRVSICWKNMLWASDTMLGLKATLLLNSSIVLIMLLPRRDVSACSSADRAMDRSFVM
jgi:hypothetical protein